ncbi:MAG: hypothetical protein WC758_07940 [Candidatus Woesearchaeota archaeon]|jgi:hypothetical protein
MEKEIIEKTWKEKDQTGNGNEDIDYKLCLCESCHKLLARGEKEELSTMIRVGSGNSWFCINCHTQNSKGKLVKTQFGMYWKDE